MKFQTNIALLFLLFTLPVLAQQQLPSGKNYYDEGPAGIVYQKETTFDIKLHTNGLIALGFNSGKLKTYYQTRFWNIELGELKHHKEYRQSFDFRAPAANSIARSFIFGKQNNFYVLRGGFGEKRYLSDKAKRKGVALGVVYSGGPSLGILKPYYLELIRTDPDGGNNFYIRSEKYSPGNEDLFLDISRIYGSSGFTKGLGQLSVVPGLNFRAALHFDWGAYDEFVKALEAGIMADFYFKKIPIMVESPSVPNAENRAFFINLYLTLQLGKRT